MRHGESTPSARHDEMAFEDFLRSVPLVHKHIMRTRRLMLENRQFRKFLELNGLNVNDVLSDDMPAINLATESSDKDSTVNETTLQTLTESLRAEQKRAANLEANLYVLQIDYDNLIKQNNID